MYKRQGELVCLDSFYIGKLKGVGKVYQLSAIDVFTRWAIVMIVIGPVDHTHSIRFIDHILRAYRRHGVKVRAVLTDNGPEYVAGTFRAHLVAKELGHQRIPARSPNHNAVCERFHQTILQELSLIHIYSLVDGDDGHAALFFRWLSSTW